MRKSRVDTFGAQLIVYHTNGFMRMKYVREWAGDNGFVVVDARGRRWLEWLMWVNVVVFALGGGPWPCLLTALWCGWEWAHTFPRGDVS